MEKLKETQKSLNSDVRPCQDRPNKEEKKISMKLAQFSMEMKLFNHPADAATRLRGCIGIPMRILHEDRRNVRPV
jgi:AMMECR1 domain-containing protein